MTLISKVDDSSDAICENNTELPTVYYNETEQNEDNSHWLKPWREKVLDFCQVLNGRRMLTPKEGREKHDTPIKDQFLIEPDLSWTHRLLSFSHFCCCFGSILLPHWLSQYTMRQVLPPLLFYKCRNPGPERVGIMPKVTEIIRERARTSIQALQWQTCLHLVV